MQNLELLALNYALTRSFSSWDENGHRYYHNCLKTRNSWSGEMRFSLTCLWTSGAIIASWPHATFRHSTFKAVSAVLGKGRWSGLTSRVGGKVVGGSLICGASLSLLAEEKATATPEDEWESSSTVFESHTSSGSGYIVLQKKALEKPAFTPFPLALFFFSWTSRRRPRRPQRAISSCPSVIARPCGKQEDPWPFLTHANENWSRGRGELDIEKQRMPYNMVRVSDIS